MERQYKTISFKKESFDEEQGIFTGLGAVYGNIDDGGDVIEPGAFEKFLENGWDRVKIMILHNDQWLPIGKPLELKEVEDGLFIKAKISDTSMGRDVKTLIRDGVLNELSIGYDPVPGGFTVDEEGIRHLWELELWEVSVVTWAMNPKATISDYKSSSKKPSNESAILELTKELTREVDTKSKESLKTIRKNFTDAIGMIDTTLQEDKTQKKSRPPFLIERKQRKSGKPIIKITN